jgi:hypothetical protein
MRKNGIEAKAMTLETDLLAALRGIAPHPAARGLMDDAAVLGDLVLTHDMIVEGVHFLPTDPPADIAWKLVAVNLSDLAAKGAVPLGVLTGTGLTQDSSWNAAFVEGLGAALAALNVPLLGGIPLPCPPARRALWALRPLAGQQGLCLRAAAAMWAMGCMLQAQLAMLGWGWPLPWGA